MSPFSYLHMIIVIALSLSLTQGCFYLVEEGKGGVAERFPIPEEQKLLSKRIHRCETTISEHIAEGKAHLYPALYKQTKVLLTESRRLFKAEYYQQAELKLEPVETVLRLMHKTHQLNAEEYLCQLINSREICL